MSGHSKWANIKHKKARMDAQKGSIYSRLSKEIMAAARAGGGNPESNFRLKVAIQKAREANIPMDNINRAIQRGTGELDGANYEELTYEGYGPGGTAVLLEILTDNRNRTAGEIRYLFSRNGGNLGETGCVAWMFEKKGLILIDREDFHGNEDELVLEAMDAGVEDFKSEEDSLEFTTSPDDLERVKSYFEGKGLKLSVAETTMVPKSTVELAGKEAEQMMNLLEALEEHDDVQKVHSNFEMAD